MFPVQFSTLTLIVMFGTVARIDPLVGLCAVSVVPALCVAVKAYTQQLIQRADRVKLIESVMRASDAEVYAAARDAFAHEFIERLPNGYDTEMQRAGQAVGRQRQRLSEGRRWNPVLGRGRLVAEGRHHDLVAATSPIYREMCE